MKGTTPAGASTEQEASRWVRDMFGRIAPRYDLANHVLSLNLDRLLARENRAIASRQILQRPGARALDLCCGTGDLLIALQSKSRIPYDGQRLLPSHADRGAGENRPAPMDNARCSKPTR